MLPLWYNRGIACTKRVQNFLQTKLLLQQCRLFSGFSHSQRGIIALLKRDRSCAIKIQTACRGILAMKELQMRKYHYKCASQMQKIARTFLVNNDMQKRANAALAVQTLARCFLQQQRIKKKNGPQWSCNWRFGFLWLSGRRKITERQKRGG